MPQKKFNIDRSLKLLSAQSGETFEYELRKLTDKLPIKKGALYKMRKDSFPNPNLDQVGKIYLLSIITGCTMENLLTNAYKQFIKSHKKIQQINNLTKEQVSK